MIRCSQPAVGLGRVVTTLKHDRELLHAIVGKLNFCPKLAKVFGACAFFWNTEKKILSIFLEFLAHHLLDTNTETPLYIIDARSKSAAVANMAVGGGYEDYAEFGNDLKINFMNIANIHVVRESLDKLKYVDSQRRCEG